MIFDEKYIKSPRPKTEPKYIGKYMIVKREVNGPYVLKDMDGEIYPRKVPIDQMKVLFRTIPGYINATNPEDVWIVEKVVNHEKKNDGYWYEVKWKGFDKEDNTWEPEKNINDQNIIDKYWRLKSGSHVLSSLSNPLHFTSYQ